MRKTKQGHLLAHKLREARRAAGLSQSESAESLHKPQSFVSRCESGIRRVDIFELQEFARVYGKALTYFLEKQGNGEKQ